MAPQLYGEAIRLHGVPRYCLRRPNPGNRSPASNYGGLCTRWRPHVNSGIINRWFYLMATDLGMDEAAKIWYATLQNLWPTAQSQTRPR